MSGNVIFKVMDAEVVGLLAVVAIVFVFLYSKIVGVKNEIDEVKKKDAISSSSVNDLQRASISTKYEIEGIKTSLSATNEAVQQSALAMQRISDSFEQRLAKQERDRVAFLEEIKERVSAGIEPINLKIEYISEYLREIRHEKK